MSFPRGLLAGLLLAFHFSVGGAAAPDTRVISAAVGKDVVLDLPDFQGSVDDVDDIRWEKEGALAAQRLGEHMVAVARGRPAHKVLSDGRLRISQLGPNDSADYRVLLYNRSGTQVFCGAVRLRILETVSKPVISWDCGHATLTCEILRGTDAHLKLCQKQKCNQTDTQMLIQYTWTSLDTPFKCTAQNAVSQEATEATIHCPGLDRALYICLVVGVCAGGLVLVACVGLLVLRVRRKRRQRSQKSDEELETKAHRTMSQQRGQGPCLPSTSPPHLDASRPPPPPAPRCQAPGYQPPPRGHHAQHQPQKRPLPSGTQVPQQKGPPLPRPRVQPEPPRGTGKGTRTASSP
ncbi:T-cell surface antigen CD2 [Perognathus longimembris pacificus]|uniref:T-cell surface antigen CD2 n=1 Tax=Perognathus longimembris pacificus TaxID=214514 RepID=UPI002019297C|nr:T-cell surface antigen CD2 [Perognathus longimembris pacificus]